MARSPEKSDPDIEVHLEEISLEELPHSLTNSGVRKVEEISGYVAPDSCPPQRFTIPPPASQVVQTYTPLLELDPVDTLSDDEFDSDDDFEFYSGDESMPPTVIPPSSKDYDAIIESEKLQSETRLLVSQVSTPPVPDFIEKYDLSEMPMDEWESVVDTSMKLFEELGIELSSLTDYFKKHIPYYSHRLIFKIMMLRDATTLLEAYFEENTEPDTCTPLGDFFAETIQRLKLRKSVHPAMSVDEAFTKRDQSRQLHTIIRPHLDALERILADKQPLVDQYHNLLFMWSFESQ